MFGGIAFMIKGHMCCGVLNDELVLRLGQVGAREALTEPHVRPMDFTGRPMKGASSQVAPVMVLRFGGVADLTRLLWSRVMTLQGRSPRRLAH